MLHTSKRERIFIMQHRRRLQIFQAAKRAAFYQHTQTGNGKEQTHENEKAINNLEPIHQ